MKLRTWFFITIILLIISIWWLSGYWILKHYKFDQIGYIGDMFGAVNALFSGLALAGIIITIYQQQKELSLQREELVQTRKVFQRQKFESTFFNLASQQQEILSDIKIQLSHEKRINGKLVEKNRDEYVGREFFAFLEQQHEVLYSILNTYFNSSYDEIKNNRNYLDVLRDYRLTNQSLKNLTKGVDSADERGKVLVIQKLIFAAFQNQYAHYYRHLFLILKYIKSNRDFELQAISSMDEKVAEKLKMEVFERYQEYAGFLQARMSTSELFALFYNGLKFHKMEELINEFTFTENLPVNKLLNPNHESFYSVKLKENQE